MKLLHLFLVVIIAEEVFSGDGNSCSSPSLSFSPSDIANRFDDIKSYINDVATQVLPFFQGADIADFVGTNQEKSDSVATLLNDIEAVLSNNGIPSDLGKFLPQINDIIFNIQSTGDQKKIDEIIASVIVGTEILEDILQSILAQIVIETNASIDYLILVIIGQVDPADYPISCIAKALIELLQFFRFTNVTIENTAIETRTSIQASP
ncbi:CLUMA_CG007038, isoform A [Clunio marinus]|uniref:CLUMA_CG007038, isoform A n=1 Tax=Clunio marinus TaxID=568069 RepID=A0A1J1I3R2_9DIPT|nr:CLUMA_CG007038, isoform A [Clunio marinus]